MGVRKRERFINELAVTANDSSLMSQLSDITTDFCLKALISCQRSNVVAEPQLAVNTIHGCIGHL